MLQRDSISHLQQLMIDGGERAFDLVPTALANVITEKQWQKQKDKSGNPFSSFESFVAHELWWGLESSIDDLLAYCRKRDDVQRLIKGEVGAAAKHGVNQHSGGGDNVTSSRGNNPTYTLRRLKRDRPDLAEKVISGDLSANAAAIEAGFRKKPIKKCPECGHEW
jgi:hypothetical protein